MTSTWLNPRLKEPKPLARRLPEHCRLVMLGTDPLKRKPTDEAEPPRDLWQRRLREMHEAGEITGRDVDLLTCIGRGMSNKEIAAELQIDTSTVKNLMTALFDRLGAANRVHAVTIALGYAEPIDR